MGARRRWLRCAVTAVVSRELAGMCEATTRISQHIAPRRPVRIVVSTGLIQPKKPWPAVRPSGCRKRECDLDSDPVVDAFLIAPGEAGAVAGPETGLAGLQKPLVRQVSAWQLRNAVWAQKVTNLQAHSHCSTAT